MMVRSRKRCRASAADNASRPPDRVAEHRNGVRPVGSPGLRRAAAAPCRRTETLRRPPRLPAAGRPHADRARSPPAPPAPSPRPRWPPSHAANRSSGTCTGRQRRIGCSISHQDAAPRRHRHAAPSGEQRQPGPSGAFAVEHQEDRPVPEVDAVGDDAQPHQRRRGQHAGHRLRAAPGPPARSPRRRRSRRRSADRGGTPRHCRWRSASPPPAPPPRRAAERGRRHRAHRDPDQRPAGRFSRWPVANQQRRRRGADQQRLRAGIGAEVDPVREASDDHQHGDRRRSQRPHGGDDEHREPHAPATVAGVKRRRRARGQQQRRPRSAAPARQVVLLLHPE